MDRPKGKGFGGGTKRLQKVTCINAAAFVATLIGALTIVFGALKGNPLKESVGFEVRVRRVRQEGFQFGFQVSMLCKV